MQAGEVALVVQPLFHEFRITEAQAAFSLFPRSPLLELPSQLTTYQQAQQAERQAQQPAAQQRQQQRREGDERPDVPPVLLPKASPENEHHGGAPADVLLRQGQRGHDERAEAGGRSGRSWQRRRRRRPAGCPAALTVAATALKLTEIAWREHPRQQGLRGGALRGLPRRGFGLRRACTGRLYCWCRLQ